VSEAVAHYDGQIERQKLHALILSTATPHKTSQCSASDSTVGLVLTRTNIVT